VNERKQRDGVWMYVDLFLFPRARSLFTLFIVTHTVCVRARVKLKLLCKLIKDLLNRLRAHCARWSEVL
jgi:hypothetical protein